MRVLVTGATGFIGRELLLLLKEKGYDITVLTRDLESSGVRLPVLCDVYQWDQSLLEPPLEALEGVSAVVHLAGESVLGRWTESRKAEISRSRVLSTHHLVQAFQRLDKKPDVFIAASATGYYGDRQALELDESASSGSGFLSILCNDWEKEIFEAESQGIRAVALRAGIVLGHDGGAMKRMLPAFRLCLGARLGSGDQWMSWIHVRDLAGLIVHALRNESVKGPINAVSPNPVTNREFTRAMGKALERPAFLFLPKPILKLALGEMSEILLDSQKVIPKKAEESGYQFLYPELEKALPSICQQQAHEWLTELWVPQPVENVFSFFMDMAAMEKIAAPSLSFKVRRQSTETIREGTLIDYSFKVRGFPMCWQSMIVDWRKDQRFSDVQISGPYTIWHHTHEFIQQNGGTLIRERAVYRVPMSLPGEILIHPFIRKDLEKIFAHRRKMIEEHFRSPA